MHLGGYWVNPQVLRAASAAVGGAGSQGCDSRWFAGIVYVPLQATDFGCERAGHECYLSAVDEPMRLRSWELIELLSRLKATLFALYFNYRFNLYVEK